MTAFRSSADRCAPPAPVARLTSVTIAAAMSRTKMLPTPLSSSVERLFAPEAKATRFPSPEMLGLKELSLAGARRRRRAC